MRKIYSNYNPPVIEPAIVDTSSDTVQGLVTSMSAILNGYDDNNMKEQQLRYSGDEVVDLYPEVFGRPTKYELEYIKHEYPDEPGGPSDMAPSAEPTPPASGSSDADTQPADEK